MVPIVARRCLASRGPLFAALLTGCGSASDAPLPAVAAIAGGVDDDAHHAVVGLRDVSTNATCTGTLVAPNVVLTAQHCVAAVPTGPLTPTTVFGALRPARSLYVTTRAVFGTSVSAYHRVSEVLVPPGERRVFGEDLALVVLAAPVSPEEATPLAVRLDPAPSVGETYTAVGYGATTPFGSDNDRRRRRDDRAVQCVASGCAGGRGNPAEWVGGDGPCAGDSGGPAIDRDERVIGVMARGGVNCVSPIYTLLLPFREWLVAETVRASRAAGATPPAWTGEAARDAGAADSGTPDVLDATAPGSGDASTAESGASGDGGSADATPPSAVERSGCRAGPSSTAIAQPLAAVLLVVAMFAARRRRRR